MGLFLRPSPPPPSPPLSTAGAGNPLPFLQASPQPPCTLIIITIPAAGGNKKRGLAKVSNARLLHPLIIMAPSLARLPQFLARGGEELS